MTSHNSYDYCLSECCTAQVAGYRTYLLHFFIKRTTATGPGVDPTTHVSAVAQDTPRSHIWNQWPWGMLHSFFFLHIFVMDLSFNKPKRTTAFDAGALCASAKTCGRSCGWICNLAQTVHGRIDVVAPFSTAGQGGDESSIEILFSTKFYTWCVKQIPIWTAPGNAKAWDEQNLTGMLQKVITYL